MRRKRFSERQVIDIMLEQGAVIPCGCGCGRPILAGVDATREHLFQLALGGKDEPANCQFWLNECSLKKSHGTEATSYGSDSHARAKVKRIAYRAIPDGLTKRYLAQAQGKLPKKRIPSRPFQKRRKP